VVAARREGTEGYEDNESDEERPASGKESAQAGHAYPPTIEARIDTSSGAKMASA
jgi:hypothetical protein